MNDKYRDAFQTLLSLRGKQPGPEILERSFLQYCAFSLQNSYSQLFQDLLVLFYSAEKKGGYFVEFGATNGIDLSNTYLLESQLGWSGILAEPGKGWHGDLHKNRKCNIDTRCVWKTSGDDLEFNETTFGELSGLANVGAVDGNTPSRKTAARYPVKTVSLNDLLAEHGAPAVIDYMSIDTEGSEIDILSAFDFTRHDVRLLTVEHNYTPQRQALFELLTRNGFVRLFESLSEFDDWYMKPCDLTGRI